jgi:hypothetical protein
MCTLISNLVCSYTIIVTTYGLRKDCIKFEGLYGLQVDYTPKHWPFNELQFYSRMCRWNINGLYNPELSTVWALNGLYSAYRLHGYHKWTWLVPLNQINQLAMDFTSIQVHLNGLYNYGWTMNRLHMDTTSSSAWNQLTSKGLYQNFNHNEWTLQ